MSRIASGQERKTDVKIAVDPLLHHLNPHAQVTAMANWSISCARNG